MLTVALTPVDKSLMPSLALAVRDNSIIVPNHPAPLEYQFSAIFRNFKQLVATIDTKKSYTIVTLCAQEARLQKQQFIESASLLESLFPEQSRTVSLAKILNKGYFDILEQREIEVPEFSLHSELDFAAISDILPPNEGVFCSVGAKRRINWVVIPIDTQNTTKPCLDALSTLRSYRDTLPSFFSLPPMLQFLSSLGMDCTVILDVRLSQKSAIDDSIALLQMIRKFEQLMRLRQKQVRGESKWLTFYKNGEDKKLIHAAKMAACSDDVGREALLKILADVEKRIKEIEAFKEEVGSKREVTEEQLNKFKRMAEEKQKERELLHLRLLALKNANRDANKVIRNEMIGDDEDYAVAEEILEEEIAQLKLDLEFLQDVFSEEETSEDFLEEEAYAGYEEEDSPGLV